VGQRIQFIAARCSATCRAGPVCTANGHNNTPVSTAVARIVILQPIRNHEAF
jgi:hypothetical protein